jgi:hypothetical protein
MMMGRDALLRFYVEYKRNNRTWQMSSALVAHTRALLTRLDATVPDWVRYDQHQLGTFGTPTRVESLFAAEFGDEIPANYVDVFIAELNKIDEWVKDCATLEHERMQFSCGIVLFVIDISQRRIELPYIRVRPVASGIGILKLILYYLSKLCVAYNRHLSVGHPYPKTQAELRKISDAFIEKGGTWTLKVGLISGADFMKAASVMAITGNRVTGIQGLPSHHDMNSAETVNRRYAVPSPDPNAYSHDEYPVDEPSYSTAAHIHRTTLTRFQLKTSAASHYRFVVAHRKNLTLYLLVDGVRYEADISKVDYGHRKRIQFMTWAVVSSVNSDGEPCLKFKADGEEMWFLADRTFVFYIEGGYRTPDAGGIKAISADDAYAVDLEALFVEGSGITIDDVDFKGDGFQFIRLKFKDIKRFLLALSGIVPGSVFEVTESSQQRLESIRFVFGSGGRTISIDSKRVLNERVQLTTAFHFQHLIMRYLQTSTHRYAAMDCFYSVWPCLTVLDGYRRRRVVEAHIPLADDRARLIQFPPNKYRSGDADLVMYMDASAMRLYVIQLPEHSSRGRGVTRLTPIEVGAFLSSPEECVACFWQLSGESVAGVYEVKMWKDGASLSPTATFKCKVSDAAFDFEVAEKYAEFGHSEFRNNVLVTLNKKRYRVIWYASRFSRIYPVMLTFPDVKKWVEALRLKASDGITTVVGSDEIQFQIEIGVQYRIKSDLKWYVDGVLAGQFVTRDDIVKWMVQVLYVARADYESLQGGPGGENPFSKGRRWIYADEL